MKRVVFEGLVIFLGLRPGRPTKRAARRLVWAQAGRRPVDPGTVITW